MQLTGGTPRRLRCGRLLLVAALAATVGIVSSAATTPAHGADRTWGSASLEPSALDALPQDVVGVRYRFRVDTNQLDPGKIVFLFHQFWNPSNPSSAFFGNQIETNFYSWRSVYTHSNTCSSYGQVQSQDPRPGEAGLFFSAPTYRSYQRPGAKTTDPGMFPKLTQEIDGLAGMWKHEHIFQRNMNGAQGTVELRRGDLITDKNGWSCLGALDAEPYRMWTATLNLDGVGTYSVQFALKESLARYWRATTIATEFFAINPQLFRVLIGDFAVLGESTGAWTPVTGWTLTTTDAQPGANTFGFRRGLLEGKPAIEVSNDGTASYLEAGQPLGASNRRGYWLLGAGGAVYPFGVPSYGNAPTFFALDLEPTPSGNGYWIVNAAGQVYAYGDAPALGNASGLAPGEHVASISGSNTGRGYWLFTNRGRVLAFGDATFYGDMRNTRLVGDVLGSIPTASGHGYYMVAADGGIFAFGDATFFGSMGGTKLNKPVNGLVPTPDGGGYWLVASDGGIFAFGNAPFRGSMGGTKLNKPAIGMVRYGNGYLMVASDGGIFSFSDKPFLGSLGSNPPFVPITNVAAIG